MFGFERTELWVLTWKFLKENLAWIDVRHDYVRKRRRVIRQMTKRHEDRKDTQIIGSINIQYIYMQDNILHTHYHTYYPAWIIITALPVPLSILFFLSYRQTSRNNWPFSLHTNFYTFHVTSRHGSIWCKILLRWLLEFITSLHCAVI